MILTKPVTRVIYAAHCSSCGELFTSTASVMRAITEYDIKVLHCERCGFKPRLIIRRYRLVENAQAGAGGKETP